VRRAPAAVHHEKALGGKAAALHQGTHALGQGLVGERLELVEQRRDDRRVEHQQHEVEGHPCQPGPQPPQAARGAHDPQDQRRQRQGDGDAHERSLGQVGQPQAERHAVEAESLFDAERLVPTEWQLDDRADGHEG
jgi:hypothetical protein